MVDTVNIFVLGGVANIEENESNRFNNTVNVEIRDYDIDEDSETNMKDENGELFNQIVHEFIGYSDNVKYVKVTISGGVVQNVIADKDVRVIVRDYDNNGEEEFKLSEYN